jgi:glutamate 5-kinase
MRDLNIKRLVIKVGTHTLTKSSGRLDRTHIRRLVEEIASIRRDGKDVALVTSGAIAAGIEAMGLRERPRDIPTMQAAASVGQGKLIDLYAELFEESGMITGQILLTQFDMTHRQQYLNARHTMQRLLELGVIPIINENDTVAVEEIRFGDNDRLAALVAGLIDAELLVMLTDIDGLYTADPRVDDGATLIPRVEAITQQIESLADDTLGEHATGGMITKIQAARIATASGVGMIILNGRKRNIITRVLEGKEEGTYFPPSKKAMAGRKRWIAFGLKPAGRIQVDRGAGEAVLHGGKSLLPAGVLKVEGEFREGEMVEILDEDGRLIARGLINYSNEDLDAIKGLRSKDASRILGGACQEAVHRNCLVLMHV